LESGDVWEALHIGALPGFRQSILKGRNRKLQKKIGKSQEKQKGVEM